MENKFDFSGWATKANIKCSDGRTIMKDAFKHNDGQTVPLVWNHKHGNVDDVLGHALLENREEGVYAYCKFNDTESGKTAKLLVQHGDVDQLSIYANQLKQQGPYVKHGNIRELSLVLAGANPGAFIENVVMMHGEDSYELEDEARIFTGEYIALSHSDDKEEHEEEVKEESKEESKEDVKDENEKDSKEEKKGEEEVAEVEEKIEKDIAHSDDKENADKSEKTIADIFGTLNEEQERAVYAVIGQAIEDATNNKDEEESEGGNETMKHNVFDQDEKQNENVLSHAEMTEIFEDAKRCGSLKEAVIAHGIEDIEVLFPDAKALNNEPEFIKRNDDWVAKVLGGVHHAPFARIKTVFADITAAEARAKGYQKGNLKIEEVFKLLKRVTNPTTVYKKQKLDRDDILDIDFNVIPWMKREMRMMLDEELARAFLVGDGRNPVDEADDKINEECIRPIWKMEDLFTVKVRVNVSSNISPEERAKAFIKAAIKSRKSYKGSGNPSMFMSEDMLTDCLLIEDTNQRVIYDTVAKLAATLRVSEIIPVPVMEGLTRTDDEGTTFELGAIYVNLKDYNVGTNKGGEVTMFDDFDIDYNQQKYLMETRCSGTLIKPYSAVAIEFVTEEAAG